MEDGFIPGVHNYCDRWCDRCPFTARCRVFASEQELSEEAKDPSDPAFWKNIKKSFEDVLDMLNRVMEEMGIDPDEAEDITGDQKPDPEIQALERIMREKTMLYANSVNDFFRENTRYFEQKEEELGEQIDDGRPVDVEQWQFFQDAIDVVRWYQYFISAKVHRAINSLDHRQFFDDPKQNDANGSAKIAMVAINRSMGAWDVIGLQLPEKLDDILELQRQLHHLRAEMNRLFPDWERFHRPGFDDEPGNMMRLDFNPN